MKTIKIIGCSLYTMLIAVEAIFGPLLLTRLYGVGNIPDSTAFFLCTIGVGQLTLAVYCWIKSLEINIKF